MLLYKEYEKQVFDWLMSKNKIDPGFTFSVRMNGNKGAKTDYFIGTEKSKYFGTTFWAIRVGFPGSSGDCIDVIFGYDHDEFNYKIEFTQTNSPHNQQNTSVLNLMKSLKEPISNSLGLKYESGSENKMFTIIPKSPKEKYVSIDEMLDDVDSDLQVLIPIVDEYIELEKKNNPDFKAHRISMQEFNQMQEKMVRRIEKYSKEIEEEIKPIDIQYWLYAPGENADKWDQFFDANIMALGWDELGDLKVYKNKGDIVKELQKIHHTDGSKKNDATANYEFINVLKKGDIVIAKKGKQKYIGYGIVDSDYYYDKDKMEFKSRRKVNWIKKGTWQLPDDSIVTKTLTNITNYTDYVNKIKALLQIDNGKKPTTDMKEIPLNQILYGPPGTGKTYNTIVKAAEIIENRKIDDFAVAKAIFNKHLGDRIEFITFHQNYSYEDFIQGLRPDVDNDTSLTFDRKDGIFKSIADRALKNLTDSKKPKESKKSFDTVFNKFISELIEGEVEELEIPMKKVSYFITGITNKSIEFRKENGLSNHTLSISTLRKMYEAESVMDIQGLSSYYSPLLNKLLAIGKDKTGNKEFVIKQNYVIVIDEINRANISRVFGELITLIESDKRSHGAIPLKATLPTGEEFIVPSNLYIIGTMNTADKSIALLDIALRRRFEFVAMYPKYDIDGHQIYDVDILENINKKIIEKKGYDFQIGHSYFMGDNHDLVKRMNVKVIPLLLEYFMNDDKEVKEILNYAGLEIESDSWPLRTTGKRDQSI